MNPFESLRGAPLRPLKWVRTKGEWELWAYWWAEEAPGRVWEIEHHREGYRFSLGHCYVGEYERSLKKAKEAVEKFRREKFERDVEDLARGWERLKQRTETPQKEEP